MTNRKFQWIKLLIIPILILSAFELTGAVAPRWSLLSGGIPVARERHRMIYDPEHAETLLFGGFAWESDGVWEGLGDAWKLNATGWHRISGYPPEGDYGPLVYDESARAFYVFASDSGNGIYDPPVKEIPRNTSILKGGTWRELSVANPPARIGFSLSYDSQRRKIVLFGGKVFQNNKWNYKNDTWEFNGKVWSLAAKSGPPARADHAAVYDEVNGCILLYGGEDGKNQLGDTWKWDGRNWEKIDIAGPLARSSAAMVYDKDRKRAVLFGGFSSSNSYLGDTWEWDGAQWRQAANSGPPPRSHNAMVYNQSIGKTQLFGGSVGVRKEPYGDLWEWDGDKWMQRREPPAPSEIAENCMVPFPPLGGLLLLSGLGPGAPLPAMWLWQKDHWKLLPGKGPVSVNHGFAISYDSRRKKAVLFGGSDSSNTWEWDGKTWKLAATEGPGARYGPSMAYDSVRDRTILFGGSKKQSSGLLNPHDTWQWDGKTWVQLHTDIAPQWNGPMAFDPKRKKMVLFDTSNTWEWDGTHWQKVATTGPSSRMGSAMAYSPEREAVILYGGTGRDALNDTWQWDGRNWQRISRQGPVARVTPSSPCLAYDEISKLIILFNQGYCNETWGLR
jgi:hypothetical protein